MKRIAIAFIFFLCGCSKSGSNSSIAVQGIDVSGTYIVHDVECYNSTLTAMTNATTYSGTYNGTITVSGNTFTEGISSGACTVNTSGGIVVEQSGLNISNEVVTNATGGSCTINETLNGTTITPQTLSKTYSTGQNLGTINGINYIYNATTGVFGFLSVYTDGGSGDLCLVVFDKQ